MKKAIVIIVILGALALLVPISNLFISPVRGTKLEEAAKGDPKYEKAALILETKCLDCHSSDAQLPFYADFPVARTIIQKDIDWGTEKMNMLVELVPHGDKPVSEVALAKLEFMIDEGDMPPLRYLILHWNKVLTDEDGRALIDWIHEEREKHFIVPGAAPEFKYDALQSVPEKVDIDPAKAALGQKLYNDKRLSGDDTISCASCHDLAKGGTDNRKTSLGIHGAVGPINAPTVYNSGYQFAQFWDGRAATLEEQASGPVNNPIEMGSNWPQAIGKLEADGPFVEEFTAVYPEGLKSENIVNAIADFERTLITPNGRFDDYLKGKADALNAEELEGYRLFRGRGCYTCHVGKIMGGQSFEKMGYTKDYFSQRGNLTEADNGRYNVTKKESDRFKFKVPTLRNIALTFPYFHDGSAATMKEAALVMGEYQTGNPLSDGEAEKVSKYMETLTGEYQGKMLK